jgi:tetratricopeptide (TPR) repeat protein
MAIVFYAGAQKKMLNVASSELDKGELYKAWEAIEVAKTNDETKSLPKTWLIRGKILQAIAASLDTKYTALYDNPLFEAYASYQKAIELDEKKKISKEIELMYIQYGSNPGMVNLCINKGVDEFKNSKFDTSLEYFELAMKIETNPMFKNIDTLVIFNAGLAAKSAKKYDKAIEYLNKAIEYKYGGSNTYSLLKDAYFGKGDTISGLATINKASEIFPNDLSVLVDFINYYLSKGQAVEAMNYLAKAKEKEPNNVSFYFAEGTMYEKMNQPDKATEAYLKATEIDPKYFNSWYNLGVMYYNKAVKLFGDANNTTDNDKYNELLKQGDEALKLAIPYMQKAHEIDPKERTTMETLKSIYFRLQMNPELEQIKAELDQLDHINNKKGEPK